MVTLVVAIPGTIPRTPSRVHTTLSQHARLESNVGELLRDAAVAGLGIAQHSTWHVGADLEAGRLRVVLPAYDLPQSAIYAVMPERKWVLPRVRALVDFLATALGETPPWERG